MRLRSTRVFSPRQFAQQGKAVSGSVWGSGFVGIGGGREEWVADSGATFHLAGNRSGTVECCSVPLVGVV